jgi:hypothetical protein
MVTGAPTVAAAPGAIALGGQQLPQLASHGAYSARIWNPIPREAAAAE